MNAFDYYKECFTPKYADFNGRARRSEYWFFVLFNILIVMLIGIIDSLLFVRFLGFPVLTLVYFFAQIVPGLAVAIRRLHDTNRSGWWLLLGFVPVVGLAVLVFMFLDGTPGMNQYGSNPKGIGADEPIEHLVTE